MAETTEGNEMGPHLFVVFTHPVDGQDVEYDRWYEDEHLDDVVRIDGITNGRRFLALDADVGPAPPTVHLALYELDADPTAVRPGLNTARESGAMPVSDTVSQPTISWFYRSLTAPRTAGSASPTHVMLAFGAPIDGHDAAFHEWYDVHLDDVLAVEGFVSASWFGHASDVPSLLPPPAEYLAVYGLATTDIDRTRKLLAEAVPAMPSMAPDRQAPRQPTKVWSFVATGALHVAP